MRAGDPTTNQRAWGQRFDGERRGYNRPEAPDPQVTARAVMYLRLIPIGLAISLLSGTATVAYLNRTESTPVMEAMSTAPGQETVTLRGYVRELGPNRMVLMDETGQVRLNLCPPWYRRLLAPQDRMVTVQGRVAEPRRWLLGRPSFDVYIMDDGIQRHVLRARNMVPWASHADRMAIAEWRDYYSWERSLPGPTLPP
jgi:hypothetical protein